MKRHCPVCGCELGFSDLLIPGIKGGDERVICKACKNIISKEMRRYNWIGLLGLPIGILLGKIPGYLNYECDVFCHAKITIIVIMLFVLLVYYAVPLQKQN